MKEPHTTTFTGPPGCGKTHLVLDLMKKETNIFLTILSSSAQPFNVIKRNMPKSGSKMTIRFGL